MAHFSYLPLVQQTLQRPLTQLEQLILDGSWQGCRYGQMAQGSGYGEEYIKQVGAKLWAELSDKIGTTVTKKNLRLLFANTAADPAASGKVIPLFKADSSATFGPGVVGRAQVSEASPPPCTVDFPSGPLPLNSRLYVTRPPVEDTAFAEITHAGCLLCIKAPRRFGKTSLLQRVIAYGTTQGYRSCRIDLQEADDLVFGSIDGLLRWFCRYLVRTLGLDLSLDQVWDPDLGSKVNGGLILQQVLAEINTPLVLSINSLERVFFFESVAQDFLSMLRYWHERSKDSGPWQQLRLVLVYGTDSYIALNLEASPFNVGHSLRLPPFTLAQFLALGRCYQLSMMDSDRHRPYLEDLHRLIAGHPYLANLSFYALAEEQPLPDLSTLTDGIFRSHLQELWVQLRQNPEALAVWRRVVDGAGVPLNAIDTLRLESLGLIRTEDGLVYPICELYRGFFAAQLNRPPAEVIALPN